MWGNILFVAVMVYFLRRQYLKDKRDGLVE